MEGLVAKKDAKKIVISLNKKFYTRLAILSAAHKLTARFVVLIQPADEFNVEIYIQPKKDIIMSEEEIKEVICNFYNDLIDEQLRLDLEEKYGNIREMIVKQAFLPMTTAELTKELKDRKIIEE